MKNIIIYIIIRYVGIAAAKIFFIVAYILGIIYAFIHVFQQIWLGFLVGVAYGVFNIFIALTVASLGLLLHIVLLRLIYEIIVSVFVIRENTSLMASQRKVY